MPLSDKELDRLANRIVDSTITVRLHSDNPGQTGATGRLETGGPNYRNGITVDADGWTDAASGSVKNKNAVVFGVALADVGTITHYSLSRGSSYVAFGELPSTTINQGDSFQITAESIVISGSTS